MLVSKFKFNFKFVFVSQDHIKILSRLGSRGVGMGMRVEKGPGGEEGGADLLYTTSLCLPA